MKGLETFRPEVYSTRHIVTSSSIFSSLSGSRILDSGGNVADAAIATSAVLAVVQNNLCGLGGDAFIMGRMREKIFVINGSGRSSHNSSIDLFQGMGINRIPEHGPMSAINVPGLVRSWIDLWKEYGSMEFSSLLGDAISLADNGFPVTSNYVNSIRASMPNASDMEWIETFGKGELKPGQTFRQRTLASTLKSISEDPESFYTGNLADKISRGFMDKGVIMDGYDLKSHRSLAQKPMSMDYRDFKVYETPPNSQGSTVLAWLKLYEESGGDSAEEFFRAGLGSMEFRRKFIGDPERIKIDEGMIRNGIWRRLSSDRSPVFPYKEKSDGDTTYFTIGDIEGNMISMIQSNYMGFGSLVMPTGTGFTLQNRGAYFSLDRSSVNCLEPEKRTFHTLSACIGMKDSDPYFSLGTMGGDVQPQIHALLIDNLSKNMLAQKSIEKPRAVFPGTIYEQNDTLYYEEGFEDISKIKGLFRNVKEMPYGSHLFGHSQMLLYLPSGAMNGGADLRGDGYAIPGV